MRTKSLTAVLKRSAVIFAVLAVSLFAAGTAANASPTGCSTDVGLDWASYYCSGGSGSYKIDVQCFTLTYSTYWRSSDWTRIGNTAYAWCDQIWPIHETTGNIALYQRKY